MALEKGNVGTDIFIELVTPPDQAVYCCPRLPAEEIFYKDT